jgi:hypothetical protein
VMVVLVKILAVAWKHGGTTPTCQDVNDVVVGDCWW